MSSVDIGPFRVDVSIKLDSWLAKLEVFDAGSGAPVDVFFYINEDGQRPAFSLAKGLCRKFDLPDEGGELNLLHSVLLGEIHDAAAKLDAVTLTDRRLLSIEQRVLRLLGRPDPLNGRTVDHVWKLRTYLTIGTSQVNIVGCPCGVNKTFLTDGVPDADD